MYKAKYFKPAEFSCRHCGELVIDDDLVEKLDKAREIAGIPFKINCGYRCKTHNAAVGGSKNSLHMQGLAADIDFETHEQLFRILDGLTSAKLHRILLYDKPGKTFVHADIHPDYSGGIAWVEEPKP